MHSEEDMRLLKRDISILSSILYDIITTNKMPAGFDILAACDSLDSIIARNTSEN